MWEESINNLFFFSIFFSIFLILTQIDFLDRKIWGLFPEATFNKTSGENGAASVQRKLCKMGITSSFIGKKEIICTY